MESSDFYEYQIKMMINKHFLMPLLFQNKTLAKRVGVMGGMSSLSYSTPTVGGGTGGGYHADTPGSGTSRSRLGRPRTTLNYSQFA